VSFIVVAPFAAPLVAAVVAAEEEVAFVAPGIEVEGRVAIVRVAHKRKVARLPSWMLPS